MTSHISEQQVRDIVFRSLRFVSRDFNVSAAGANNLNIEARGRRSSSAVPANCPFKASVSGSKLIMVTPGYLMPVGMPSNMFIGDSIFSADITAETMFLVGKVNTNGITPTSWEMELRESPAAPITATPETAPPYFEFDMYVTMGNGASLARIIDCGNLVAEPKEYIQTSQPDPGCGVNPMITHYTWLVSPA